MGIAALTVSTTRLRLSKKFITLLMLCLCSSFRSDASLVGLTLASTVFVRTKVK